MSLMFYDDEASLHSCDLDILTFMENTSQVAILCKRKGIPLKKDGNAFLTNTVAESRDPTENWLPFARLGSYTTMKIQPNHHGRDFLNGPLTC
jgi:hypothetical protein